LGEAPLLASPTTWWCGDPASLSHIVSELERLVVKPVARGHAPVVYGWELDTAARAELVRRLRAEPWLWCGQEPLELSTTPVVTPGGLEPRRFVLRAFGVAAGARYAFLPGGLGRVAGGPAERTVSSLTGLAKDVWVSSAAAGAAEPAGPRPRLLLPAASPAQVPPRVAGTLLAIGRHAERAESTARLFKIADDLTEDHSSRPASPGAAAMRVLTDAGSTLTGIQRRYAEPGVDYLRRAVLDAALPGSVAANVATLIESAQHVRDLMSVDTWSVFGRLERTLAGELAEDDQLQPLIDDVLESLLAYAGIMAQSMVRDSSWAFLDAGGRLERAARTVALLRHTVLPDQPVEVAELVAESVLRSCESIITHRRRAAGGQGPAEARESALTLLVHDESNPRSVAHQLAALAADLRLVGDEALAAQADSLRRRLDDLPVADPAAWLDGLDGELAGLDGRIAARHFVRQASRHSSEQIRTSWTQEE
ncbi:MAG: circularly permuted type 2 ATP-grasp protein, partial [Propionicimonas sp.]|nr:circularly permuted type 2 ATP-grasp protein [Propionicimonas sp.]